MNPQKLRPGGQEQPKGGSVQDLLTQIRQVQLKQQVADSERKREEGYKLIAKLARNFVYPKIISFGETPSPDRYITSYDTNNWGRPVRGFDTVPMGGNKSYPAIIIPVNEVYPDYIKPFTVEQLAPEKTITVVLTDETTNIPFMTHLLGELAEGRKVKLAVDWDFEVDVENTRITKAKVKRVYEGEVYRYEGRNTAERGESRGEVHEITLSSDYSRYDFLGFHRVLFSADGNLSDRVMGGDWVSSG